MIDCDMEKCARQIIDLITGKLDCSLIENRFDEPIAKVALEFRPEGKPPFPHKVFHKIIGDFVGQIYEKALKASWMLTDPLAEAIFLLENHYRSSKYGSGYEAAASDADDPTQGGIQTVLTSMAESIKDIERKKYIDGIFTWYLHSCSWELQCEIARLLLEEYQPFIPPLLRRCVPAQLVDEIQSIMYEYICSDFALQQRSFFNQKYLTAATLFDGDIP